MQFLYFSVFLACVTSAVSKVYKCDLEKCPQTDENKIKLHIVPYFSHSDWVQDIQQFNSDIVYLKEIIEFERFLDFIQVGLRENPERRFTLSSSLFLNKSWKKLSDLRKDYISSFVQNGQIEIIANSWTPFARKDYYTLLEQYTDDFKFLNKTFGSCGQPKVMLHEENRSLIRDIGSFYAEIGIDTLLFSEFPESTQKTDIVWIPNAESQLYVSFLRNYSEVFEMALESFNETSMGFGNHLNFQVEQIASFINKNIHRHTSSNILILIKNIEDHKKLDLLIDGFSLYPQLVTSECIEMEVFYSSPSCYQNAVIEEIRRKNFKLTRKYDDIVSTNTSLSNDTTYEMLLTRYEFLYSRINQINKQLSTFTDIKDPNRLFRIPEVKIDRNRHEDRTYLHHEERLMKDMEKALSGISDALSAIMKQRWSIYANFDPCLLSNISQCDSVSLLRFVVAVYNPLGTPRSYHVRLPVNSKSCSVTAPNGTQIKNQVSPSIDDFKLSRNEETGKYNLFFLARDVPALGFKFFYVETLPDDGLPIKPDMSSKRFELGYHGMGAKFDPRTGLLNKITITGLELDVQQSFMYYDLNNSNPVPFGEVTTTVYKGELLEEVHQKYNNWLKQVVRIFKTENHVELDWLIGPIDASFDTAKVVISRFTTNLTTGNEFYTDSNGKEKLKIIRNAKPLKTNEFLNQFNPINNHIHIVDRKKGLGLAVLTDHVQKGSSTSEGEMELIMRERLTQNEDDVVVRGMNYLILGSLKPEEPYLIWRERIIHRRKLYPTVFVGSIPDAESKTPFLRYDTLEFHGLNRPLPSNISILTLQKWRKEQVLLRLEHMVQEDEMGREEVVDLNNLFTVFDIKSIRETNLVANQWKNEVKLYDLKVVLMPAQIRTFIAHISYKISL